MALLLAAIVAFTGGGLVARITNQPFLSRGLRQLILAGAAAGLTYAIGVLVGASVG
jgi:vacuolar iron transporter family protein